MIFYICEIPLVRNTSYTVTDYNCKLKKQANNNNNNKTTGLDFTNLNNYGPISNLPFIFNVLEHTVASVVNLYEPFQSGFHSRHSTERAPAKIPVTSSSHSVLAFSPSSSFLTSVLVLTSSTEALLLEHLKISTQHLSGLHPTCLTENWQKNVYQNDVFHHFGIHFYADDTQMYYSTKTRTSPSCPHLLPTGHHQLGHSQSAKIPLAIKVKLYSSIDGCQVPNSHSVRSLWVILENTLCQWDLSIFVTFRDFILFLSSSCSDHLFFGILECHSLWPPEITPQFAPNRKNSVASVITQTKTTDNITPILIQLPLNVEQRLLPSVTWNLSLTWHPHVF